MADLVMTTQGQAAALAAAEALASVHRRIKEETEAGARAAKVWNDETVSLGRSAQTVYHSMETEQERIADQIAIILRAMKENVGQTDENKVALERLRAKWVEVGQAEEGAIGKEALGKIKEIGTELLGIVGIGTSIAAAFEEFKHEYDSLIELRAEAGREQLSLAASQEVLIRAQPGATPKQVAESLRAAHELAGQQGVPENLVDQTLATAYGATQDRKRALAATSTALSALPDNPAAAADLAKELTQIGPGSPLANLGFIQQVAGLSGLAESLQRLPGAILAGEGYGLSQRSAGALFAAIASGTGDISGRIPTAALAGFGKRLTDFDFGTTKAAETDETARKALLSATGSRIGVQQSLEGLDDEDVRRKASRDKEQVERSRTFQDAHQAVTEAGRHLGEARTDDQTYAAEKVMKDARERLARLQEDEVRRAHENAQEDQTARRKRAELEQKLDEAKTREAAAAQTAVAAGAGNIIASRRLDQFQSLSTDQRVGYLRDHPELLDQFFKDSGIDDRVTPVLRRLLTTGDLDQFVRQIPSNQSTLEARGRQLIDGYGVTRLRQNQIVAGKLQSFNEDLATGGEPYLDDDSRKNLQQIMQREGASERGAQFRTFVGSLGDGSVGITTKEAVQTFKDFNQELKDTRRKDYGSDEYGLGTEGPKGSGVTPQMQKLIDQNDQVIELLTNQLIEAQKTNAAIDNGGIPVGGDD